MSFIINKGDILVENFICSASSSSSKHAQILVKPKGGAVYLSNVRFTNDGYNALEQESGIHPDSDLSVSKVIIENCSFEGKLSNNAISFYNLAENAEITIRNCTFNSISNMLRISNNYNSSGIKIRLENCEVLAGEGTDTSLNYRGLIIFQDYTSSDYETAISNNCFGSEKISITLKNCKFTDKKTEPHTTDTSLVSASDVMPISSDADKTDQLIYVYYNKGGLIYGADKMPTVAIE